MRWKLYAGILAIFLLGGVAGVMVGVQYERTTRERMMADRARKSAVDFFSRRMAHELDLNADQLGQVRAILEAVQPELQKLEETRREGIQRIMDETQPRMLAVLNEEQKRKFVEMQERIRTHLNRKFQRDGQGPRGRGFGPPGHPPGSPPGGPAQPGQPEPGDASPGRKPD